MVSAGKTNIFIVEDHPYMREILRQYLEMEDDFEICGVAETAEIALESIPLASPDLVLVDVSLPGMSGIELVTRLRAADPDVACLMLSGHGERSHVRRAAEAGARGYVLKSDTSELSAAIRRVATDKSYFAGMQSPL
ncbi:MAG: response regulator [Bacteroidota bacterium]